ncbi:olfactory receptor 52K2-like [Lepisosteus oculatus]|uniref:olfactory receptor 52K2-like n=1 Tax=Lepisosteus oculatus TaxID=7918 RepID=UPI003713BF62
MHMNNSSDVTSLLSLESFNIPPGWVYPAFILGMFSYCIILFCNLIILLTIGMEKHLHEPMYLLLFNLPINDLIGATALFPALMKEILLDSRSISYTACVIQGFFVHIYAVGSVVILTAMAYDRYLAICCPLRYHAIMTNTRLMKIIILIWIANITMIVVLFLMVLRLPRCRSLISNLYCDNFSLMRLVCTDTSTNNIYGLFITFSLQALSISVVIYTYLQILFTCLNNKLSDAKGKAIQTCGTHLVSFVILEVTGVLPILAYRIEGFSPHAKKILSVFVLIFPPTLNPIIYGLRTKEIRSKIPLFFIRQMTLI